MEKAQRRLAAILAVDVAGWSRLMGADEAGTLTKLKRTRSALIDPAVAEAGGRIFNTTGDGLLAEFPSAGDAVGCAVRIQTGAPALPLRIAVNLGDVIADGADLFGDGVNVAARLQEAAEAGGIAISGAVHEIVAVRGLASFEDAGERSLKNIDRPVRVWRWRPDPVEAKSAAPKHEKSPSLLGKPSIIVLPFVNMSGDPEQEFFADGMTEDITTALSRLRWFLVIARNSAFTFKGRAVDVKRVGAEMGVQYVLEGSVRKAGDRIRVTAQLIDVETAAHVWAEKYDRDVADLFAIQDEITASAVAAIEPQLYAAESSRASRTPPDSLDAWGCVIRGLALSFAVERPKQAEAQRLFRRAAEISPGYANAYSLLGFSFLWDLYMGWATSPEAAIAGAADAARKALALDSQDAWAHLVAAGAQSFAGQTEGALSSYSEALRLNPNFALAYLFRALPLAHSGAADAAEADLRHAERLAPGSPLTEAIVPTIRAVVLLVQKRFAEAAAAAREAIRVRPQNIGALKALAIAHAHSGNLPDAAAAVAAIKRLDPGMSLAEETRRAWRWTAPEARALYLDGLRLAGLT
jgi:adenylate cyclase